ncbi:MAG: phospholipase D family protein, partial [Muribaculaceae bacterium]|nr:phospholipase D family protein [Muribaculaceae bacterium]
MDDLVYNEIVATPGYELEFAVGTTYGLDAEAFLAVALSFARLGDATDADFQSPFRLLEGLRQANNRVAIFCNRGGLQPPVRKNPLYAMLDKSVFEVADERKGKELANFHPKIWVIKERSLDDRSKRQIKLIVMSRNLTKDTSLDVAVTMTAPLGVRTSDEIRRKHQPLKEQLLILADKANTDKKKKIRKLANELDTMGEFELEKPYEDYEFLPIHFGENLNPAINFRQDLPGQKMVIVSPFLDKGPIDKDGNPNPIKWLNDYRPSCEKVLITRLDSLTPEIMELYSSENREVWVMSPIAEQNDIQPMNLHAKMYFSWGAKGGGIYLWLGSANATRNGFYRNSEFMVKLKLKRGRNQFEDFKAEFCDEKKQMCERITSLPELEAKKEDNSLTINVRKDLISHNNLTAQVVNTGDDYIITINAKRIKDIRGKITLAPIQEPWNEVELTPDLQQCRVKVTTRSHLSEFYILKVVPFDEDITPVKIVIKINTTGIPEDRDDHIFRSLIDTRDKFLNYVEMMITDHPQELASMMMHSDNSIAMGANTIVAHRGNTLYESLLRIAATNPDRLEDIEELVNRLDTKVVPDSFRQ